MPWRGAATVLLDPAGRCLDADDAALELLGVPTVETFRSTPPERFAALPQDAEEQAALRKAYFASRAEGVLAEAPVRRFDGELIRVRTAILDEGDGRFRALVYLVERPTTDLSVRVYRIGEVLAEWRSAERQLVALDPDSDEARDVARHIELLREQHHLLFSRARERYLGGSDPVDSIARSMGHVSRAMEHIRRTLEGAERKLDDPDRAATAQRRIVQGERMLGLLEAELQALRQRDFISARYLHLEFEVLRADAREEDREA